MVDQTNPRKVYLSGNTAVISLPRAFREAAGIDVGDQFVLEATETGFQATEVEMRVVDDV